VIRVLSEVDPDFIEYTQQRDTLVVAALLVLVIVAVAILVIKV